MTQNILSCLIHNILANTTYTVQHIGYYTVGSEKFKWIIYYYRLQYLHVTNNFPLCLSSRRMIRKVIAVIYPVFVYKAVIANCHWSLARFDWNSGVLCWVCEHNTGAIQRLAKTQVILQHFSQKHDVVSGLFVHEQVHLWRSHTKHTEHKPKKWVCFSLLWQTHSGIYDIYFDRLLRKM